MPKRVKVLVSVLVVVVLLTVAGSAVVMAQGESTLVSEVSTKGRLPAGVESRIGLGKSFGYVGDNMTEGLLARVAEKLGITGEELTNAFEEAQQEIREEAFIGRLDKAVAEGRITEDEANEIKAWYEQRPEVLDSGLFQHARTFKAMPGRNMWGRHMRGGSRG
ncbi:hypothetical protein ACFLWO_00575 [Chloroflexota bacterium]